MQESPIRSVSELNNALSRLFEAQKFQNLRIKGEISGCKKYSTGTIYFSLKDDEAQVSCVLFKSQARTCPIELKDGLSVVLTASITYYARDGKLQLRVSKVEALGEGFLYQQFLQLKAKLEAEGLFDSSRKKPLPYIPKRIGVITSASGAVIKDIIHVLSRRFPGFNLLLFPVLVQGNTAASSMIRAIKEANHRQDLDLLIIGRGGGSMEDLWCFNDEALVREVAGSRIPIISAVGHETDFTLCDFAADKRAPTPSAAAEIAVPVKAELFQALQNKKNQMFSIFQKKIDHETLRLDYFSEKRILKDPLSLVESRKHYLMLLGQRLVQQIQTQTYVSDRKLQKFTMEFPKLLEKKLVEKKQDLDTKSTSLENLMALTFKNKTHKLLTLEAKLEALNPLALLNRGYAHVSYQTDSGEEKTLSSIHSVELGTTLQIALQDGVLKTSVLGVEEKK